MAIENQPEKGGENIETATFESRVENAPDIAGLVEGKLKAGRWTDEEIGNFPLAVNEAATNAIVYGNKQMPDKKVVVETNISPERAVVVIKDEGEGFDPDAVPNPVEEENITKTHGRGLFLMRELCDKVEYRDGGRTVALTKYKRKPAEDVGPGRVGWANDPSFR